MNVLLISANRERFPYPVFPLGLAYLTGPMADGGHCLEILDLCFAEDPHAAISEALERFTPGAVLISIRNIDNVTWPGSRSYLGGIRDVVRACHGKATVILGGSGFSIMSVELMAHLDGDYGVVGEGEEVLPRLLAALAHGEPPEQLPGVLVRGSDSFLPPKPVELIGRPDRSLFLLDRYHREGGMANMQTKRGCPFTCTYCTYPLLEGNRVRVRPIADIIAEIGELVDGAGVSYIYFVDDIFNYPPDFAEELCRSIAAARFRFNWSAFINPGFVTPTLLEAMVAAGCDAVEFGSEAGAPSMLQSLGKSFSTNDIRASSGLCREMELDFAHYILFGGPGETVDTIDETFAMMDEVRSTAVIAMTGIRIFPGTSLYRTALAEGVVAHGESLLEPVFYISSAVRDNLGELVTERALQRRNWVAPGLEINMSDGMLEAIRHFPVRGPLWKLLKGVKRSRVRPM